MKRRIREIKHSKIEIIPMIDTMFFLLVFFILVSLNMISLRGMKMNLPSQKTQAELEQEFREQNDISAFVNVGANGVVTLGDGVNDPQIQVSPDLLGEALIRHAQNKKAKIEDVPVVVRADRNANYGLVIRCIDSARKARFSKIAFQKV